MSIKKQLYVLIRVLSPIFSFLFYIVLLIERSLGSLFAYSIVHSAVHGTIRAGLKIDQL